MNSPVLILYLEDDPRDVELVRDRLQQTELAFRLQVAVDRAEYEAALAQTRFDLIISDNNLPDYNGMAALALARATHSDVPFILISGVLGEEQAVESMHHGATDYVLKQRLHRLAPAVLRALAEAEERHKRRGAEESLRKTEGQLDIERKFRAILDQTYEFIGLMTLDGTLIEANRAALAFAGIAESDVIGKPFWETPWWTHSKEMQDRLRKAIKAAAKGEFVRFQATHPAKSDGSLHHIDFSLKPVKDESGNVVFLIPEGRDITEFKRLEEAFSRASVWEKTFDAVPDMIALINTDFQVVQVNRAMVARLGCSAQHLVGKHCCEVIHGTSTPPESCPHARMMLTGKEEHAELAIDWLNGVFEVRASPLCDESGKVVGCVHIARDITARKQAEEARRRSEEQYRTLFAEARDGICLADATTGEILDCNPAMTELAGRTRAQLLGQPQAILHPAANDGQTLSPEFRDFLANEPGRIIETQVLRPDGTLRTVEVKGSTFRLHDRDVAQGVFYDVTERKQTEATLAKAREELEISERQKSQTVERLNDAQETANIGSWDWDLENESVWWSNETYRLCGVAPGEYTPNFASNRQFIHPDDWEVYQSSFAHSIKTGKPLDIEMRILTGNGPAKWCRAMGRCFYDESGKPIRFAGTLMDITDRVRAEAELALSALRTHSLLELHQLAAAPADDVLDFALDAGRLITQSQVSWVGFLDETESTLSIRRWSKEAMTQCSLGNEPRIFKIADGALWSDCVKKRMPALVNDYSAPHPSKKGIPEGHAPIRRFLAVPVIDGPRVVAIAAVANKAEDYSASDVGALSTLANKLWEILRRQEMEESLRLSEERFRSFAMASEHGMGMAELDGKITYVNASMSRILDEDSEADCIGKSFLQYYRPEDMDRVENIVLPAIMQKNRWQGELPLRSARGKTTFTEQSAFLIRNQHGEPRLIGNVVTDITERKRMEEAVAQTLRRQQGILTLEECLLQPRPLDEKLQTVAETIVRLFDADFCRIWLTRPGDLCDRGCIHALTTEGPDACARREQCLHLVADANRCPQANDPIHQRIPYGAYKIGRIAAGADPQFLTNDVQHDPNMQNHEWAKKMGLVAFAGYPLESAGDTPLGVLAVFAKRALTAQEDALLDGISNATAFMLQTYLAEEELITSNRHLEEATAKAQEANVAKSQFLANMSHELRTPLNAVIGFSEGLLERTDIHPLNEHQKDRLGKIKASGEYLLHLINSILDVSKAEAGKLDLLITTFDVEPVVWEVGEMTNVLLKDKPDVQFAVDMPEPMPQMTSDRDKLRQILLNLLANATKFTQRGSVVLRVRHVHTSIVFSVADTGIGVSPEYLDKLFEPFFQATQTKRQALSGTGLGLSIAKTLTTMLRGALTVDSVVAQGTTFTLTLPLVHENNAEPDAPDNHENATPEPQQEIVTC